MNSRRTSRSSRPAIGRDARRFQSRNDVLLRPRNMLHPLADVFARTADGELAVGRCPRTRARSVANLEGRTPRLPVRASLPRVTRDGSLRCVLLVLVVASCGGGS